MGYKVRNVTFIYRHRRHVFYMSSVALCLVWCSLEEGFKFGYNSPRIPQARLTPTRARTFGVLLAPESKATTLGLTERVLPLFWAWGSREVMPRFMHRPCALSVIRLPFMYSSAIHVGLVVVSQDSVCQAGEAHGKRLHFA